LTGWRAAGAQESPGGGETPYLFGAVAQTGLSAGSGDFPVPGAIRETALECTANPQAGKPALVAADAPNGNEPAGRSVWLRSKHS